MAKYIDYKKLEAELFKRTEGYAADVRKIYRDAFTRIINLVKGTELEPGKPFSFSDYGYSDEVTPIFRDMYSRVYQVIRKGVEKEWLNANEHNDDLVKAVFGDHSIEDHHFARFFARNQEAMDAFFSRKTGDHGLNLSQRVWNYNGQFKEELENALDLAIGEGCPANRLAKDIQKYLNEPDRFYRRFRVKIGERDLVDENGNPILDENGNPIKEPIYGRKWKRRIWDKDSDSYKWIDADPKHYHPGRGVYRSSCRNAQRLARTETNIAYRTADYDRWQRMDFVIGIEIKLSNNHPCSDICDDLKGMYPKNFKWVGWHPNCRCYQVPVLASETEVDQMLDKILDGDDPASIDCAGAVEKLPSNYDDWAERNADRMERARENGTLPYFIRDNEGKKFGGKPVIETPSPSEIARIRHQARTPEEIAAIQQRWNDRKVRYAIADEIEKLPTFDWYNWSAKDTPINQLKGLVGNYELISGHKNNIDYDWLVRFYSPEEIKERVKKYKKFVKDELKYHGLVDDTALAKFHELRSINIEDIPAHWRSDFLSALQRINEGKKDYWFCPWLNGAEYAQNIIALSRDKNAIKYGLERLSSKTPVEIFTKLEKEYPGYMYSVPSKAFFDQLTEFVPLRIMRSLKERNGAWYSPSSRSVTFNLAKTGDRLKHSVAYRKDLFYHEYGHAMDAQRGWVSDPDILKLYREWKAEIQKDGGSALHKAIDDRLKALRAEFDEWAKRIQSQVDKLTEQHTILQGERKTAEAELLFKKIDRILDMAFEKRKNFMATYTDQHELLGALSDCLGGALDGKSWVSPRCHDASYFAVESNQVAEFIAHMSECLWSGNKEFERLAPKLYKEMRELLAKKLGITLK